MTTPLTFIGTVRRSFPDAVTVYTRGSCYQFYKILKHVFPDAEAYIDLNYEFHVITRIGDHYYDINGKVSSENFVKMDEYWHKRAQKWRFKSIIDSK